MDDGASYWDQVAFATTGANGTYTLGCRPATTASSSTPTYMTEYYNDALDEADADLVAVTATSVTGINAALVVGGKITGTVRDTASAPLQFISVTAYRLIDGEWDFHDSVSTNASGVYTLDGLRAGTYRVGFRDFNDTYLDEFYVDKDTVESAADVPVALGATATANATLDRGGVISGVVSGPAGPVPGAP